MSACPNCDELVALADRFCACCGHRLVGLETLRAHAVPSYGMRATGGWGVRGWRVHCPTCAHLSDLYVNNSTARGALARHRERCT